MRGSLIGVRAKIDRAKHHLTELTTALNTWGTAKEADHLPALKYNSERHSVKVFLEKVTPNDIKWPLIVGDVVHNLRSALDHLACQLAIASRRPSSCCRQTAFPICIDEKSFESARKKIEPFVRPEMFALIQDIQPYIAANLRGLPVKASNLAIISELDIIDKHRVLLVAGKYYRVTEARYRINEGEFVDVPFNGNWQPLKEGAHITEINFGTNVPKREDKMRVQATTEVQIFFSETGYACDGLEVVAALESCITYVKAIVDEFGKRFFSP